MHESGKLETANYLTDMTEQIKGDIKSLVSKRVCTTTTEDEKSEEVHCTLLSMFNMGLYSPEL